MFRDAKTKSEKIKIKYNYSKPLEQNVIRSSTTTSEVVTKDEAQNLKFRSGAKQEQIIHSVSPDQRLHLNEKAVMNLKQKEINKYVAQFTDAALDNTNIYNRIKTIKDPKVLQEYIEKYSIAIAHKDASKLTEQRSRIKTETRKMRAIYPRDPNPRTVLENKLKSKDRSISQIPHDEENFFERYSEDKVTDTLTFKEKFYNIL